MANGKSQLQEKKAALTRREILEACRRLFASRGYVGTTMADIAAEAGLSVQTIYNYIGGKAALLEALLDLVDEIAQVQDTQRRIAESEDPVEILTLTAQLRRRLMEGAGDIVSVVGVASKSEPDLHRAWADAQRRSYRGIERIAARLDDLQALRENLDRERARDVIYAILHPSIYERLVDECGWTPDEAERWFARSLYELVLENGE